MKKFEGKVVIITGASSGIGETIAVSFAKEGASLCITGRNAENLKRVGQECIERGSPKVVEVAADLDDPDSCQKIVSMAVDHLERIDVLVNNAGWVAFGGIESLKLQEYDKQFNVNLRATFVLTQLVTPYLKKVKGSVVNVSSRTSKMFVAHFLIYGMTKSAMDYFTKSAALELGPSGVRVNAVNPGIVRTKIHAHRMSVDELDKYYENAANDNPLGRLVTTQDVADAVLFLASEDASMITGSCLLVDGGLALKSG